MNLCGRSDRERSERNKGAPVATNKEQRPNGVRERRGREMVSAPVEVSPIEHRRIHPAPETLLFAQADSHRSDKCG